MKRVVATGRHKSRKLVDASTSTAVINLEVFKRAQSLDQIHTSIDRHYQSDVMAWYSALAPIENGKKADDKKRGGRKAKRQGQIHD